MLCKLKEGIWSANVKECHVHLLFLKRCSACCHLNCSFYFKYRRASKVSKGIAVPSSVPSSLPRWVKSHLHAAGCGIHSLQRYLPLVTPDGPHISENGNASKKPHGVRKCNTGRTKLFHSSLFWQIFNPLVYPCLVFTHKTWNNSIYQVYLDGELSWPLKWNREEKKKQ